MQRESTTTLATATIRELKSIASELGIRGYSRMVKADLLAAIQSIQTAQAAQGIEEQTVTRYQKEEGEEAALTANSPQPQQPSELPTWRDLFHSLWLLTCVVIALLIYGTRLASRMGRSPMATTARAVSRRWLLRLLDASVWTFAGLVGWRTTSN